MATLKQLIECEISDFFAGFGHPGEPETPEEMQSQLLTRVMPLLAGMEQEPVYQVLGDGSWTDYSKQQLEDLLESKPSTLFRVAYAAPQLPQPAVAEKAITLHFDTIALDVAKMVMCDVNRRHEFLGGDVQLLSRIQCRIDDACRAAMLQGAEPVSQPYTLPDDTRRLDWLDAQNKRLNDYYGTAYGWKFDANFQRNAMMLNDSNYPVMTVRQAIDEAMAAAPQQEAE